MPHVLEMSGYHTTVAASVSEALGFITTMEFDVLLSDLNIGEPGDGFTVVSAMRRSQPKCRNFILTGYPAFESALTAIRAQVDDFFVKPANPTELVEALAKRITEPSQSRGSGNKRVSTLLREQSSAIVKVTLEYMRMDDKLSRLPLNEEDRADHLRLMVQELAETLESKHPEVTPAKTMRAAESHGRMRFEQGFKIELLVRDARMLMRAIHDCLQSHLLELEISTVIPDLKWLDDSLAAQLEVSISSYLRERRRVEETV